MMNQIYVQQKFIILLQNTLIQNFYVQQHKLDCQYQNFKNLCFLQNFLRRKAEYIYLTILQNKLQNSKDQPLMNKILLPDFPGNNLLFHCISHGNAIDALNLLQNKQAEINARNVNGCTPLHMAVMIQNMNLVKLLISYGADVNLKEYNDVGQKTALHYAVEKNNFEIATLLLDNGANPCLGDKRQMTALHYAARFGFKQIVKLLMTHGADINVRDMNGFNAAHWAKMNQFTQIVQMIGPPRSIGPNDYQEYKKAMIQIHQISLKKKKKKGKKKK